MINIVLDTNIIISAALSSIGNPAKIINLIVANENLQLYYSTVILNEYKKVLSYKRLNFSIGLQTQTINVIINNGICVQPDISDIPFIDESDRVFYDTAKIINAYLVTGNLKHYPVEAHIITPLKFLDIFNNDFYI